MKKQLKILIALVAAALVLGGLVIASAQYSIKAITDGIDAIGKVTWSEESRERIDAVDLKIGKLDPNLHLTEKIGNLDTLKAAKVTYVEQAIIRLYRAVRDKEDEAVIRQYLTDAEEAFSHYLTEADIPLVHNYQDLADAKEKYGENNDPEAGNGGPEEAPKSIPVELC